MAVLKCNIYFCSTVCGIVEVIHASFLGTSIEAKRDDVLARSRDKAILAAVLIHVGNIAVHITY